MTERGEKSDDDREARLARALRDNLRRRKTQARARQDAPAAPEAGDEGEPWTAS